MEEEGLVSAATGALQPALGKLAALLGDDEDKRLRGEAELLTRELAAMDAFLLAKSSSSSSDLIPSAQDKACMHEIRELSYDIDDDLHDFMEASVCDKSAELAGLLDKMKAILGRTKARHEMIAKAVDDLKEQVVQVAERHNHHKRSKVDRRAPAVFDDASKLVGLDGPKQELIQLLAGSDSESTQQQQQPRPNLVAVVGSGGMGKTTLANHVYQELQGQLDCHAFCSVRRNPDRARVLRSIYNQLYSSYNNLDRLSSPRPGMRDLPGLITMISDYLENRRYVCMCCFKF